MNVLHTPTVRRSIALWQSLRRLHSTLSLFALLILFPALVVAQSPFDSGFTAMQTLFTGTVAKVASLIAIVVGGYQFAHGEPGAKNNRFGYVSISRASHEATIFTDDITKLNPQLSSDVSKTSDLEIGQGTPVAPEVGIGVSL
jgi:type IV secretion system protein VirB2